MIGNPRETHECLHKILHVHPGFRRGVRFARAKSLRSVLPLPAAELMSAASIRQAVRWANLQIVPVVFDGSWQARRN